MSLNLEVLRRMTTPSQAREHVKAFMRGLPLRSPEYIEGIADSFVREAMRSQSREPKLLHSGKYREATAAYDAYYAGVEAGDNALALEKGKSRSASV